MELVMRVLIEADDDDIAQWAKQDGVDVDEVVKILKRDAEDACSIARRQVSTTFDFIEWEEQ